MIRPLDANDFGFEGTVLLVHELEDSSFAEEGPTIRMVSSSAASGWT
jgi:hypothetical protein